MNRQWSEPSAAAQSPASATSGAGAAARSPRHVVRAPTVADTSASRCPPTRTPVGAGLGRSGPARPAQPGPPPRSPARKHNGRARWCPAVRRHVRGQVFVLDAERHPWSGTRHSPPSPRAIRSPRARLLPRSSSGAMQMMLRSGRPPCSYAIETGPASTRLGERAFARSRGRERLDMPPPIAGGSRRRGSPVDRAAVGSEDLLWWMSVRSSPGASGSSSSNPRENSGQFSAMGPRSKVDA